MAFDAAGNLYVCDAANGRIRRVNAATNVISTVAGNGAYGFSGDGGPAPDAALNSPNAVAFDSAGRLFIADEQNHRIRRVVFPAPTSAAVTSSLNPSAFGQSVTFTASVTPASATGTVQFFDGATLLGDRTLSGGTASLLTTSLAVGSHSITASYGGDPDFSSGTSPVLVQTVNKAGTTTSLSSSANPSDEGQLVTFTATVSPASATGSIQFYEGATLFGTATLSGGVASLNAGFPGGSPSLTAVYTGNASFQTSTSPVLVQKVRGSTAIDFASLNNPSTFGQPVTFSGGVAPNSATGAVQFLDGAALLGATTLTGGNFSFTTSSLSAGTHWIKAVYNGTPTMPQALPRSTARPSIKPTAPRRWPPARIPRPRDSR